MEFTIKECSKILKTLPIGYYCGGGKISLSLSETEATSFYNGADNSITISYPIIAKGLEKVTDEAWKETAVRSMLYHEVSHAILTPTNIFKYCWDEEEKFIVNVFEDERIETILNSYYLDVNFKQNLFNIVGEKPTIEKDNPQSIFYALVRYRFGEKRLLDKVSEIIEKYKDINRNTEYDPDNKIYRYYHEIKNLYNEIKDAVELKSINPDSMEQDNDALKGFNSDNVQTGKPKASKNENEGESESKSESESESGSKSENENESGSENKSGNSNNEENSVTEEARNINEDLRNMIKNIISNVENNGLTEEQNIDLRKAEKTLEMIITNFNKKNSGGNGYNGYSGIFNPRAVIRDDYKYFDRIASINGNNTFGTCHLNLVIDRSGSFEYNTHIINSLLIMLTKIERKNPNFSMDVSFINTQFKTCKTFKDRRIKCGGGNDIPENWKEIMGKLQKNNSYNYNIVLFDGDALSDNYSSFDKLKKIFKQLDQPNTTLITDKDNVTYMKDNKFTKAKVIVTRDYTDELISNIIKAFSRMFS